MFFVAVGFLLLAFCFSAQAQQTGKIPRIGFQLDSPASSVTDRTDAFPSGSTRSRIH